MPDVVVVGAGPTGLMTAVELQRAGVDVLVVEREPERTGQSKALALQPRSVEVLDDRGLLEPLLPDVRARIPAGHFSGMPVDYACLPTRFPYQLGIEQARVEEALESRLQVPVLRDAPVTAVTQDDTGVHLRAGGHELTAAYVVAADGGHSAVRSLLGAAFPGTSARYRTVVADVTFARRPAAVGDAWELPTFDGPSGYVLSLGGGRFRFLFGGAEQQELDGAAPVSPEEVQRALDVRGDGAELDAVLWASRFGDASRQLERYRHGRVLFAGDAAHIHVPMGGQGLNLGLQDAANLGWKLAAQVRGTAPDGLLDSYHDERHPIAARVRDSTRAQSVLVMPDPDVRIVRGIVADLVGVPEANQRLAMELSGLGIRYPMPGGGGLLGTRAPAVALPADGRAVLVGADAPGWADRVETQEGCASMLVRPDGYVCWVGGPGLEDALHRWLGSPVRVAVGGAAAPRNAHGGRSLGRLQHMRGVVGPENGHRRRGDTPGPDDVDASRP